MTTEVNVEQIRSLLLAGKCKEACDELVSLRRQYLDSGWMDNALRKCMFHILHMIDGADECHLALKQLDEFYRLYRCRNPGFR